MNHPSLEYQEPKLPANVMCCEDCEEPLLDGDTYLMLDGLPICSDCVDNMSAVELLDRFHINFEVTRYDS